MKVRKRYVYLLVSRDYIGHDDDDVLFISNSLKSVQEWFDYYKKNTFMYVEILKRPYYEILK